MNCDPLHLPEDERGEEVVRALEAIATRIEKEHAGQSLRVLVGPSACAKAPLK